MTYGRDYLTRYAPAPIRSLVGERTALAAGAAQPPDHAQQLAFAEVRENVAQQEDLAARFLILGDHVFQ
jgi:hypothetical protein